MTQPLITITRAAPAVSDKISLDRPSSFSPAHDDFPALSRRLAQELEHSEVALGKRVAGTVQKYATLHPQGAA